jgi:hypothetical protein
MATGADAMNREPGRHLAAAAVTGNLAELEGKHVEVQIIKHSGDLFFMGVTGDHAPHRLQPPYRLMSESSVRDSTVFCNLHYPNTYWLALNGGTHCAVYDVKVTYIAYRISREHHGARVFARRCMRLLQSVRDRLPACV